MSHHRESVDPFGNYYEEEEKTREEYFRTAFDESLRDPEAEREKAKLPPWWWMVGFVVVSVAFLWAMSGDVHGKAVEDDSTLSHPGFSFVLKVATLCDTEDKMHASLESGYLVEGCRVIEIPQGREVMFYPTSFHDYPDGRVGVILRVVLLKRRFWELPWNGFTFTSYDPALGEGLQSVLGASK